jgi:Tfp pilus assembly protein PilO
VGRFHDIEAFFDQVAQLPRIVNVNKLGIKIADESALETVLKVSGEAVTFRFLEEAEAAAAAEAAEAAKGGKGRRGAPAQGAPHGKAGRG